MDVLTRLRTVLPQGWFPDTDPVLDTILSGMAAVWNVLLGQLADTRDQARLLTATGDWLDAKAQDFLGAGFQRRTNEADTDFAARTAAEVLRKRGTRPALAQMLTDEGSPSFRIFEPARAADTGGMNTSSLGYDVAGGWGSLLMPYQVILDAHRPPGAGIPNNGGWDGGLGFDVGGGGWGTSAALKGGVTDAELYDSIARVLPAGVTAWTRLS